MFLPGIFQHKCRQPAITRGTEIPKGSAYVPAYNPVKPWVLHTFTWEPLTECMEQDSCRAQRHSKSCASYGLHFMCNRAMGKKRSGSDPAARCLGQWCLTCWDYLSTSVKPWAANVSHLAGRGHAIALSWQHSSCDLCFAQKYKDVEASQSLRLMWKDDAVSVQVDRSTLLVVDTLLCPQGGCRPGISTVCASSLACSPPAEVRLTKTDCLLWKCESVLTGGSRWWNKGY